MSSHSLSTRRRGFLATLAAGAGTVAAGVWSRADAATLTAAGEEAWVGKIHGKYRQVFDAVSANQGFGVAFALNFIKSTKVANPSATDADISPVVVLRHFSMPLTLTDAVWAKYKLGEVLGINDPKTNKPATRNIFHNAIPLYDGMTYQSVIATQGVTIVACNMALTVISGMAAPKAGVSADVAKKDFTAGLIPGVALSASGVYAVNRAQNAGGCTYCFAG